jgi:hypothetical protein
MSAYLEEEILDWAHDKGILGAQGRGTEAGQHMKTLEEVEELTHALADRNLPEIADAIGDIYVTLVIQAEMQGLRMSDCIDGAYNVISKRTGKMVNGQFVKDQK